MFTAPLTDSDPRSGVDIVECTIPADMTIAQWRRARSAGERARHTPRALGAVLRLVPRREKLVESIPYEPRLEPTGATVHSLRSRVGGEPERRAA